MTWIQYKNACNAMLQFALLNLCEPMRGFRECYKNIDPAREMTETELKMYAAGGAIRG